jgi:hypothetical protein
MLDTPRPQVPAPFRDPAQARLERHRQTQAEIARLQEERQRLLAEAQQVEARWLQTGRELQGRSGFDYYRRGLVIGACTLGLPFVGTGLFILWALITGG